MINISTVQGNLTRDPELNTTPTGIEVAKFTIAWNEKYKDTEKVEYYNCVAWRQTGVFVNRYFKKGSSIIVCGKFETRNYEDKEGNKRYVTELIVDNVHFCGGKSNADPMQSFATSNPETVSGGVNIDTATEDLPF